MFLFYVYGKDSDLNKYILELPYNAKDELGNNELLIQNLKLKETKKELDFYYKGGDDNKIIIEVKFHRQSHHSATKPMNLGSIFNDLRRLDLIKNKGIKKLLVYVFDEEMHDYLLPTKGNCGLREKGLREKIQQLFDAGEEETVSIEFEKGYDKENSNQPKSFYEKASSSFIDEYNKKPDQELKINVFYSNKFKSELRTNLDVSGRESKKQFWIRVFEVCENN